MARIVTVYHSTTRAFRPVDMSYIRWLKISEALAEAGHEVDIATNEPRSWWWRPAPLAMGSRLRRVPLSQVRWAAYDVVKTLFHVGFETLERYGGTTHPFIISKLGSVVGPTDMDGVLFYGDYRRRLYDVQERIARTSHYVTLLSVEAQELWRQCFGPRDNLLLVPAGVDRAVPPPANDPYPPGDGPRCLFAGNIYDRHTQPEGNRTLVHKLNTLGARLRERGARLFLLGRGEVERLDPGCVTLLGAVTYDESWPYLQHADVGVVLAAGNWLHNNESSKIYHYLRVGLPTVTERAFPNDQLVTEAQLGFVTASGDMETMADRIVAAAAADWDRERAMRFMLAHHTWERRAAIYDELIRSRGAGHAASAG